MLRLDRLDRIVKPGGARRRASVWTRLVVGDVAVAYVQAVPGAALDVDSLASHCRRNLAKAQHRRPSHLLMRLPKNPAGKPGASTD